MQQQILVAHIKAPPYGHSCVRCDRASVLGNPYAFTNEAYRHVSIQLYRRWLWRNIQLYQQIESTVIDALDHSVPIESVPGIFTAPKFKQPSIREVIQELERISQLTSPIALLCWCKNYVGKPDKPCHCDVIKSCLEKLW